MAKRKLSPKQIRIFGTKRQKAALKRKRTHRHRANPHRAAPKRRAKARKATHHRKRRNPTPRAAPRKRARARKRSTHRKRRNPVPQIVSWVATGNPAKRRKKAMARRRTKRRASARHSNAGRRHTKRTVRHHRRRNPGGLGGMKDWVQGGAGVLVGVVGTRAVPQMVLGASNTGAMGYGANVITALGLGYLTSMVFKGNRTLVASVIAGGFAATLSRVIADRTPYGAQFSLSGLGDWGLGLYQKSNYPYPPRLQNGRGPGSSMFTWGDGSQVGMPIGTIAAGGADSTAAC